MPNQVKLDTSDKPVRHHGFLLVYFILSIGFLGTFFCYVLAAPFWLIGIVWRPARALGGELMRIGVVTLFKVQPWFRFVDELKLPARGQRNFITVSNHRSHLDMFILLSRIPNIRVISKAALFRVPFLGLAMRFMRMIPVKKGSIDSYMKAMELVGEGAKRGDAIHIFPEMSRCDAGTAGTQPFHLAPFRVAVKANLPLVPIVFVGTDRVWPKGKFGLSYRQPLRVRSLDLVDPAKFASAEDLRSEIQNRIENCLQQL